MAFTWCRNIVAGLPPSSYLEVVAALMAYDAVHARRPEGCLRIARGAEAEG